jgi:uncharacterized membrane protein YfcA
MILLFLFTDLYALAWAAVLPGDAGHDLLGARTLQLALWLTPAMLAGIGVGQRVFIGVSPEAFRRQVLNLLMLIAAISVVPRQSSCCADTNPSCFLQRLRQPIARPALVALTSRGVCRGRVGVFAGARRRLAAEFAARSNWRARCAPST